MVFYHETSAIEIEVAKTKERPQHPASLQKIPTKISKASTGTLIGTQSKSPRFLFEKRYLQPTDTARYGHSEPTSPGLPELK